VAWYERQRQRGIARPCLYASASVMQSSVVPVLLAAAVPRSSVRLWSAHYSGSAHICGPASCKLTSIEMDGCQFTDNALGRDLDESLLAADLFGTAPTPPATGWTAAMISDLPLVKQGDTGNNVRTVQALCVARGHATTIDGAFGNATATVVRAVQTSFGISADAVVGPATWAVLVTASKP
jgi:Putative peptidoglycan binding domain